MTDAGYNPVLDIDASIHRHAWWATMLMYRKLVFQTMETELQDATGVDLATYDVLMHVAKALDAGARMTDLARDVFVSKPGLTKIIDRLEERDLVLRTPDPEDRRAIRVTLTDHGKKTAAEAARTHLASIQDHFEDRVSEAEARTILEVMERITPPQM